jgi:MOSC domain-containing protein YiiM
MGRLERIWIKRYHGGPMNACDRAELCAGRGIVGNADQGGRRQVTLLSRERWTEVGDALGTAVPAEDRRANLLLSGIRLERTSGRVLRVGACRLRIAGETRPCGQMEEVSPGLQESMRHDWGGGAFAEILDDGAITVGDDVRWEDAGT